MKGFSHFMSGLAVASCYPPAVEEAARGNPIYFILGGAFALLPDTLDFKALRYFHRHDAEVVTDPLAPDPQMIADAVAAAADEAARRGMPFRLKLHTIRLGADRWLRYTVRLDPDGHRIHVSFEGPADTGGNPDGSGMPMPAPAAAPVDAPLQLEYLAEVRVDILEGPDLEMTPMPDGAVRVAFIPWHRYASHSLITGAALAAVPALLWGPLAGVVAATAHAAHVALDQLGYMGSNLFWPLTRRRVPGLKRGHASQTTPNLTAVWLSTLLIYWNLAAAAGAPPNPLRLFLFAGLLPCALSGRLARHFRKVQP